MTTVLDPPDLSVKLSADDITALRTADSVTFHLNIGFDSRYYSGIRCIERDFTGEPRIYSAKEQRVFPVADGLERRRHITVPMNTAGGYDERGGSYAAGNGSQCFEMLSSSKYSDTWQTIAGLLKIGDEIRLKWTADYGSSPVTREAGVHVDQLLLMVQRANGSRLHFIVRQSTCRDNTARMCRLVRP